MQRIAAAVLAAGTTAVASHRSAATLWGIERPADDPVDIIVDRSVTRLRLDGVVVHRPTDRVDMPAAPRQQVPTTNLLRTVIDLGAVVGSVDEAVAAAITSGAVTPAALEYLLGRHARQGRAGTAALRRALEAWPLDGKPADSELEPRMAMLLTRHRLPPATFHPVIGGHEVDFLVDDTPIVLECDGWRWHARTPGQYERDRERDAELGALATSCSASRGARSPATRRAPPPGSAPSSRPGHRTYSPLPPEPPPSPGDPTFWAADLLGTAKICSRNPRPDPA